MNDTTTRKELLIRKKALHTILVSLQQQLLYIQDEYTDLEFSGVLQNDIDSPEYIATSMYKIIDTCKLSEDEREFLSNNGIDNIKHIIVR